MTLASGQREILFELRCGIDGLGPSQVEESERRRHASMWWSDRLSTLRLPGVQRELVARGAPGCLLRQTR